MKNERVVFKRRTGGNRLYFTVYGQLVSGKNRRRIVKAKGTPRIIPSEKAQAYAESFNTFVQKLPDNEIITEPVRVWLRIFYASKRPDLEPSLFLDLMQGKVIENDRQIWSLHCDKFFSKEDPRVEVEIEKLDAADIMARESGLRPLSPRKANMPGLTL